ncbi:MAG: helix-turn-helix domain-containing protein [Phycisphaerae bacterium]
MQRLKDEIRERIVAAALRLFARHGYQKATIAEIAAEAGIATGNLYRYFRSKEDLLAEVVPDSFVRELFDLMTRKVRALDGVDDIRSLPAGAAYQRISAELLDFSARNRLRMIILTSGVAGSPLADVPEKVVSLLKSLALEHFRSVSPELVLTRAHRVCLDLTYRNFIRAASAILLKFRRERDIREALAMLTRYHLTGLRAVFEASAD